MAVQWRLAKSLQTLLSEVNKAYPNRSKAGDGGIGDAAHSKTASDHNPNAQGVVTAFDITHDPKNGLDAHELAEHLIENPNPNLKYVISNSRIAGAFTGWNWRWYDGINPHSSHIHISVGRGADGSSVPPYDGTETWNIKGEPIMQKTAHKYLVEGVLNRPVTASDEAKNLGKDPNKVIIDMVKWAKANNRSYGETVDRLKKELAAKPKQIIVEVPVEIVKEVPVEVVKEVEVEKIVEVVKDDDERSIGDLLSALWRKIFNIK